VSKVNPSPAALGEYFTNNMPDFRIPRQIQVSYVKFDLSNHLAKATEDLLKMTNLNQAVDAAYTRQGAAFFKDPLGNVLPPDQAKQKIKDDDIKNRARVAAEREANDFIAEVIDVQEKEPKEKDLLERVAASKGFMARTTEPFSEEKGPFGHQAPQFADMAFALSEENPIPTTPVAAEDGFYVIAFKNLIPSRDQPLEAVLPRVTEEYKKMEAFKLSQQDADKFIVLLTNGLAAGKSFGAVAAENNLKAIPLPAFSPSSRQVPGWDPALNLDMIKNVSRGLSAGQHSTFLPMQDGGLVLFVRERQAPDPAGIKTELPEFITQMKSQKMNLAFQDWLLAEVRENLKIPQQAGDNAGSTQQ
jgi:hypothetical protein